MSEVNVKNKNSTPTFTRGTLAHLQKAVADGLVTPPAFHFLTDPDKLCLAFVDIDKTIYQMNLERIEKLESVVSGLIDPETGEVTPVKEYVNEQITPVSNKVDVIEQQVSNTIMVTSLDGGGEN